MMSTLENICELHRSASQPSRVAPQEHGHEELLDCFKNLQLTHLRPLLLKVSVSLSGLYRPPGGDEEMQRGGRKVRLEWRAYITV
ncbi:hypothetical protein FHG87_018096 [Trinorchestia longiramus]|nr:hypothetical protein FHG87_018096 [Trinorchestia longiramus]